MRPRTVEGDPVALDDARRRHDGPGAPAVPNLPNLPDVPDIPDIPDIPDVPDVPDQATFRHALAPGGSDRHGARLSDRLREQGEIDWALVTAFRTLVAGRLALGGDWRAQTDSANCANSATGVSRVSGAIDSKGVGGSGGGGSRPGADGGARDRAAQERFGWVVIADLLREHAADVAASGAPAWTGRQQSLMGQAVFDAVFRLGRLQPLVEDDRVENIFILGCRQVLLELTDGSRIPGPAVAETDEELIDFLRFLAARSESNPRPFSQSMPRLHMKLDGGARLAATAWVVSRPTVVIRRHRLMVDSLDGWVERGCMSPSCANLLAALVRASWSVAVSGPMSAGKTTLMRALCAQIPRGEAIGTFETEYELFLGETGQHEIVIDWEARPGLGEVGADGRAAGAFELADALTDSFRFALSRQIVGEIRGSEVWTMIKAMESGTGSLSTTHAATAETCIRKLVTCAMEAGSHVTRDLALEKLTGCLDVIVQLARRVEDRPDGSQVQRRWVSEVVLVEPGEKEKGYALTYLFGPAPPSRRGPARATGILPPRCRELVEFGFDPDLYQAEADGADTADGAGWVGRAGRAGRADGGGWAP
ncbi:CpaF/VirB11 family protein [Dermatophilaceae bacterium Soc4.6]